MAKITRLTADQEAKFPEYVRRWTEIGLSTELADRPRAEAAIRQMYVIANLAPPKTIVWCGSPLSMALTRAILLKMPDIPKKVWDSVGASVRASVGDSVWASVGDSVWASVGDSVWDSVWDSVGDSVYGQHDASWLAFYRFFHDECGLVAETQRLDGLWEFSQASGWAIPCRDICFIAERHTTLNRDERGRLHCETAPAVEYPDGWRIFAVHGVRVPEIVVMGTIGIAMIAAEKNTEIQRVMIERFGWDRYAEESQATVIDYDERWGTLMKSPGGLFLRVVNRSAEPDGSFRNYILPVSDNCEPLPDPMDPNGRLGAGQKLTALNAVASTFGMTGEQYQVISAES